MARRKRLCLYFGGSLLLALAFLAWVPRWIVDVLAWAAPQIVWRVATSQPVAAITFDDGPDPRNTPQVLDILARHNVRATFFLVGEHARQHPELVERIRAEGHEIGNHTDSLGTTFFMSEDRFAASLRRAEQTLGLNAAADGTDCLLPGARRRKFFRPAGGTIRPSQAAIARRHAYTIVLGSSYAWDPAQPPATYIRWAISKNLAPGAIAVLHDAKGDRSNTVAALEGILASGATKGLRWVTLSELLAEEGK